MSIKESLSSIIDKSLIFSEDEKIELQKMISIYESYNETDIEKKILDMIYNFRYITNLIISLNMSVLDIDDRYNTIINKINLMILMNNSKFDDVFEKYSEIKNDNYISFMLLLNSMFMSDKNMKKIINMRAHIDNTLDFIFNYVKVDCEKYILSLEILCDKLYLYEKLIEYDRKYVKQLNEELNKRKDIELMLKYINYLNNDNKEYLSNIIVLLDKYKDELNYKIKWTTECINSCGLKECIFYKCGHPVCYDCSYNKLECKMCNNIYG